MKSKYNINLIAVWMLLFTILVPVSIVFGQATGGTVTLSGTKRIHKFTTTGTFTITGALSNVRYTVVGGGGAGLNDNASVKGGPGGGGGQVVDYSTSGLTWTITPLTMTVGAAASSSTITGTSFTTITAAAGTAGSGTGTTVGGNSGSVVNGTTTSTTGGTTLNAAGGGNYYGGGGAGAGANGGAPSAPVSTTGTCGAGGNGITSSIDGLTYGGGGGGGTAVTGGTAGSGGTGGGGAGSKTGSGTAGSANTGGGGGGGTGAGAAATGGSGIIIVDYDAYDLYSGASWVNGAPSSSSSNGLPKVIATGSTYTLASNINWGTDPVTIQSGATIDCGTFTLICGAITNNGTLKTSSTSNPPFTTSSSSVGSVQFAAASGAQFIPGKSYTTLTLSNTSGTNTATGNIGVTNAFTIGSTTTLDMSTFGLTLSSTLTNSGTLKTSTTTNPAFSTTSSSVGIVEFSSLTGGQFIPGKSYTTLTLSNTSGTNTAVGAISVANGLAIGSNTTLDMSTFGLTLSSTITNNGTLKTSTTTNPAFSTTSSSVGIVEFAATAGGQFIPSKSYTTLTLSNTSGTNTALGAISVTNPLTVGSNTTLDMSTFGLTLTGAITNNGTLKTSSTSNPPFTTTSTSISGTVQFAASTGGQFVPAVTYNNLSLTNSSGNQTLNGNTRIQGTLTISSGGKLNTNGFSIPAVNAFSGTGQITGGSSFRMNITGSSGGTFYMDQATPLTTNRVKYLGLAANATATLGNTTVVYGDTSYSGNVDLKSGSVLTSNTTNTNAALLEFRYGTAGDYHGVLGMNGGSLVGEALVEDYFVSGFRAFRQTGHVLDSALSLNQITDDFDLFGTISSGSSGRGSAGNKDGLYAATSTAKNSVFTYKEDVSSGSKWLPFTATSSNSTILPGTGIMFVMRPTGSGESGNYNAQIMDYEGAVNQRRRAISVLKNSGTGTFGYNLLANPYAAYLNFDRFIDTNTALLADKGFYKYDKSIKNYTTHSKSGSQWYKNSTAFSVNTANIDPGDAFWLRVSSVGTVYMNPNMTTYNKSNDVSKGNKLEIDTTIFSTLGIKLKSSSDSTIGDEATILSASWGGDMSYKNGDMSNMKGTCIDISVVSSDKEALAFKTLDITKSWLIPLNVQACAAGSYSFSFDITANKTGYETEYELLDKYLNKSTKIVSGNTLIFQITSDSASMGGSRFYLNAVPSKLLSTESLKSEQIVTTFPNPISKNDVLKINVSQGKSLQIQLINAMGQKLYSIENVAAGKIMEIDLTSLQLSQGIYYLNSTRDNKTETQRVIIY